MKLEPIHWFYLVLYIATGSSFSLLVKGSQTDGKFKYEPVVVTLLVEFCKLIVAGIYYFFFMDPDASIQQKFSALYRKRHTVKLFAVPAALYCAYNAFNFFNLTLVTPATFRVLINLKVFISGILLRVFFNIHLSFHQWVALCILCLSCVIEQVGSFKNDWNAGFFAIILILIQAFCSSFAGVYFQFLLQREKSHAEEQVGLWEKNFFLYIWSVIFNIIYLIIFRQDVASRPLETIFSLDFNYIVPIIFCSVIGGFSTSLILRYLDVIVKEYANFAELCVVVVGNYIIFANPIKITLVIAVMMVSFSLYLYNSTHESPPTSAPSHAPSSSVVIEMHKKKAAGGDSDVEAEKLLQTNQRR